MHTVTIILVIFRSIDTPLGRDTVSAARTILVTKARHVVTLLGETRCSSTPCQAGANYNHTIFTAVGRVDQLHVELVAGPLLREWAFGDFGIEIHILALLFFK